MAAWVSNAVSTLWLHESYTGPTAHVIMQAFRVSPVHMHGMYSTGSTQSLLNCWDMQAVQVGVCNSRGTYFY